MWWAQRTSFNTLDNWGHKTPNQSKRKRTGKKSLKGHGLEHTQYTRLHCISLCAALGTSTPFLNHVMQIGKWSLQLRTGEQSLAIFCFGSNINMISLSDFQNS